MRSALRTAADFLDRAAQLARLTWGLPAYLRTPLTMDGAASAVRHRLVHREDSFLNVARHLIYAHHRGPLCLLLHWAGCEYGDLERLVRQDGVENTLERLRAQGVYVTHDEFTGTTPLCRSGLSLDTRARDFDNPFLTGKGLAGSTSGSQSQGIRMVYSWAFIAEEAADELLLHHAHAVGRVPLAYWMPGMPALSGIHNLLIDMNSQRPPARWFSQVQMSGAASAGEIATQAVLRAAMGYVLWCARRSGVAAPRPEYTPLDEALRVATWMAAAKAEAGGVVLKTYASSAVRVAQAALAHGVDIAGSMIFTGGEPLTARRRRFIESTGAQARARYVATESGLIAGACAAGGALDDMHAYTDRLAVIGAPGERLLVTALSPHAGKLLLNTDLGDCGRIETKRCDCFLGAAGLDVHLSGVHSIQKLTGEGMTLLTAELDTIIGDVVERAGGTPDDYQFWESEDDIGLKTISIAVSPQLTNLTDAMVRQALDDALERQHLRGNLTAQMWEQAQTIHVVRQAPQASKGYKLLPIVRQPS